MQEHKKTTHYSTTGVNNQFTPSYSAIHIPVLSKIDFKIVKKRVIDINTVQFTKPLKLFKNIINT